MAPCFRLLGIFLLLSTTACVSTQNTTRDALIEAPAAYDYAAPAMAAARTLDDDWLAGFNDQNLVVLVDKAQAGNLGLEAGLASVRAAQAALKSARAGWFPSLSGSASASSTSESDFETISRSAGLTASYQLDLFGQTRLASRSARQSLAAQEFDQRTLELTVQSDVAASYILVLSLRAQLETAKANLDIAKRIFELVQVRHNAGAVSGFDLESQRASLAELRARIPQLEQQLVSAETALAILLGRAPQGYHTPQGNLMAMAVPAISVGLPSDLLLRRPDLAAAEARLRAAEADIAAARAAYFPTIDLSASLSSVLVSGADIIGSAAASLAAPIFSGGRLSAQTDTAKAQRDALIAQYKESVFNAFRDVDVALSAGATAALREADYQIARRASAQALSIAETQYRTGAESLTSLLNAQSAYFSAQDNVTQARADRLQAAVDLNIALGGGWTPSTP